VKKPSRHTLSLY